LRALRLAPSEQVEITHAIEEETMPGYSNLSFLPVNVGQIINDRYDVIAKFGSGTDSTV
jgi:serine/threonine-protein kinase SRPK3